MRKIDPLLVNYSIRIREVILVILIILSTLFFAMPKFLDEAQAGDEDNQIEVETFDIPPTQMVEQQKPLKPAIPVPEDDEFFEEEIEFQDTDFDSWDDWDAPEASTGPNIKFIPFDTPPTPKRGLGIKPIYPEIAKEAGIEGTVYIQFFIDEKGNVTEAYVQKGVPNTGLDEAALSAVKKSKWKPARQREKKVGVWQTVPVRFELK
jgi:protein TonB